LIPSAATIRRALVQALRAAGNVHRHYAGGAFHVFHKGRVDIVTTADKVAERVILRMLRRVFPDHGFLMEESGEHRAASPFRWVVDPLDGTTNFAHGLRQSCVSIGLEKDGRVIAGGVYNPFPEEMFLAFQGKGAFLNGRRIHVSKTRRLMDSLIVTGFPYDRTKRAGFYLKFVERFMKRTQGLRRLGSAALDLAYVACGRFDGYWEFNLKPWDAAAGLLLVEEAGGQVTNFKGRTYGLSDTSQTLASNGRIHPSMIRLL